MFVLMVSRGYPSPKYLGNGIFEFDQAQALAEAGHKVVFAAVDLRSIRRWRKWGIEHFIKRGVDVYAFNIPIGRLPHRVLLCAGQFGLRILFHLIYKEHGTPDIVHAHFLNIAEIALCLKSKISAKFVMTEHWSLVASCNAAYPQWVKRYAERIYKSYDKVITVSQFLAERLNCNFNVNPICIPNMLDSIFLKNIKRKRHDAFVFIFVGNLIRGKSPLESIQAFYDAFQLSNFRACNGQKIYLHLIGDGSLFNDCQQLIRTLGIEEHVTMLGQMTRSKIKDILCSSDCLILPSKLETFGVVYIEAMACGLPVIATKCGGPEYFVDENNGLLINIDDHKALVDALKYMSENQTKYNSSQIHWYAVKNFSPKVVANELVYLYQTLLKDNDTRY